jgi:hypothetical protein
MRARKSKYGACKAVHEGVQFDSRKELRRWLELLEAEKRGEITNLRRQVPYVLIPEQREPDTIGKRGGVHRGRLIERECKYISDIEYDKDGQHIVEDVKGMRTPDYIIKRKLMLYIHNIRITEV